MRVLEFYSEYHCRVESLLFQEDIIDIKSFRGDINFREIYVLLFLTKENGSGMFPGTVFFPKIHAFCEVVINSIINWLRSVGTKAGIFLL